MLHNHGVRPKDRVAIYMPLIPEAIASMLAVARLGAIHTVVFGGFAHEALAERIADCEAIAVITAECSERKGQVLELRKTVERALANTKTKTVQTVLCFGEKFGSSDARVIYFSKQTSHPSEVSIPKILKQTTRFLFYILQEPPANPRALSRHRRISCACLVYYPTNI